MNERMDGMDRWMEKIGWVETWRRFFFGGTTEVCVTMCLPHRHPQKVVVVKFVVAATSLPPAVVQNSSPSPCQMNSPHNPSLTESGVSWECFSAPFFFAFYSAEAEHFIKNGSMGQLAIQPIHCGAALCSLAMGFGASAQSLQMVGTTPK